MAIDGFDWDTPDTPDNAAEFGYAGSGANRSAFPKARAVTISECVSHTVVAAEIGGMSSGEQTLARRLYPDLEAGWLLIADRNFYGYDDWNTARAGDVELLWRVSASVSLPVLAAHPDRSYASVLVNPKIRGAARARLIEAARRGEALDPARAVAVRVVEYTVPDREGIRDRGADRPDHHHHRPHPGICRAARRGVSPAVGCDVRSQCAVRR